VRRRDALGLAVLGAIARQARAAPPIALPLLCLFSKAVAKVSYTDMGEIVKQFGFDGVDLTVRPGGHVEPRLSNVDLVRAFESIAGAGLECPMITTGLTSPLDPAALAVIAISGRTSIPLFRVGEWRASTPLYRREIAGLIAIGSRYGIAMALHNYTSENSGETDWNVAETLEGLDPKWCGAYFDPIHHGENWQQALMPLLPRLRAVAIKDFQITRAGVVPCPLGEGVMNWERCFSILAAAKFSGPLSLRIEYAPKDELGAIAKDCQIARKQLEAAYARRGSGSGAGSGSGMG
jgi:L-ribulose-5-phosphate 3-epimerase